MLRFDFAKVTESKFEKYVRPDLLFVLLVFIAVIGVTLFIESNIKQEIQRVKSKITSLEREKNRLKNIGKIEKELLKKKKELEFKLSVFDDLNKKRKVPDFLYFFSSSKYMENVWLVSLSLKGKSLEIGGVCPDLRRFYTLLEDIDLNMGMVTMKDTVYVPIPLEKNRKGIYRFSLKVKL